MDFWLQISPGKSQNTFFNKLFKIFFRRDPVADNLEKQVMLKTLVVEAIVSKIKG